MAKLLLDELFFERDNSDGYIDDVIEFVCKYFDDDIVFFHPYCNPGNLWMLKNEIASIEKKVMKKGKIFICDLNAVRGYNTQNSALSEKFKSDFIQKIKYICDSFEDAVIFNAPEKHDMKERRPVRHVYVVNHVRKEIDSNIAYFIVNRLFMTNVIEPTPESPLPNIDLCREYKSLQDELTKGKSVSERIPIFLQVGKEVLQRNAYIHNERLSSVNTTGRKIRDIYQNNDLSVYGSIDVESGSIEICNHNGCHEDEYGFDNERHNKHDSTGKHDIKLHN